MICGRLFYQYNQKNKDLLESIMKELLFYFPGFKKRIIICGDKPKEDLHNMIDYIGTEKKGLTLPFVKSIIEAKTDHDIKYLIFFDADGQWYPKQLEELLNDKHPRLNKTYINLLTYFRENDGYFKTLNEKYANLDWKNLEPVIPPYYDSKQSIEAIIPERHLRPWGDESRDSNIYSPLRCFLEDLENAAIKIVYQQIYERSEDGRETLKNWVQRTRIEECQPGLFILSKPLIVYIYHHMKHLGIIKNGEINERLILRRYKHMGDLIVVSAALNGNFNIATPAIRANDQYSTTITSDISHEKIVQIMDYVHLFDKSISPDSIAEQIKEHPKRYLWPDTRSRNGFVRREEDLYPFVDKIIDEIKKKHAIT